MAFANRLRQLFQRHIAIADNIAFIIAVATSRASTIETPPGGMTGAENHLLPLEKFTH
jgi:hypothetical protein